MATLILSVRFAATARSECAGTQPSTSRQNGIILVDFHFRS
jgi:hypothetical protein